jgi:hypothetical protein
MVEAERSRVPSGEVVVAVVVGRAVNGERREERKVDCGSKGPMGGRENFWRSDWAYEGAWDWDCWGGEGGRVRS